MTNKRSWLKNIVPNVVGRIVRIGDQVRSISLSPRRRIFPKWFFWVKFIVLLVISSLVFLLIMSGIVYIVFAWSVSGQINFYNSRKEVVRVHQVAVDGRGVLVDERRSIGLGFYLSRESVSLDYGLMKPNTTHRILVRASSASAPVAKDYACAIYIPSEWGDVSIYFENHDDFRCKFDGFMGY